MSLLTWYYHIFYTHSSKLLETFPKNQLVFATGNWQLVSVKNINSVYTKVHFAIFKITIYWYKFIKNYYILLVCIRLNSISFDIYKFVYLDHQSNKATCRVYIC